jgi:TRAP-type C4-dicarboxylate transport system permease small subunit
MEVILELIVDLLGDVCCQAFLAIIADTLFGVAAVKVRKARQEATGEPSKPDPWLWMYWILLPLACGFTGLLIYTIARRSAG